MTGAGNRVRRRAWTALAAATLAAGCTSGPGAVAPDPGDTDPGDTDPVATAASAQGGPVGPVEDIGGASVLVDEMSSLWVAYVGSVVVDGRPDPALGAQLGGLYDAEAAVLDAGTLDDCVVRELDALGQTGGADLWQHSSWRDHGFQASGADGGDGPLWTFAVADGLVARGDNAGYDGSVFSTVVVGPDGIVGHMAPVPNPEGGVATGDEHLNLVGCLDSAVRVTVEAETMLALATDPAGTDATTITMGNGFDSRAVFTGRVGNGGYDENGQVTRRPGFPADPADPEPIASTGSNGWDLITVNDPSAFVCVEDLGQGPEEFLPATKDGGYQRVEDAYLYRAWFSDGTVIDMRVHPEIGSKADADAELDRYLVPLGQLPTVLRRDIGRFAVRLGDNTATASQGEGMMLQSGNASVRLADRRLEETLFHESVHTSLDPVYAYQRSQAWLDAQEADGRWLTEYGRENPDSEDLAETALYGYAVLHHPERLPAGVAAEIVARVPNRLEIIESIFPPGEPVITPADAAVPCGEDQLG